MKFEFDWYLIPWKKYATFDGRARRSEYWYFTLINILIMQIFYSIESTGTTFGLFFLMSILFGVASAIPTMAVGVRRLHDIGRSGWWLLINVVPLFGQLVFLVFTLMPSEPGANRYGQNPISHGGPTVYIDKT